MEILTQAHAAYRLMYHIVWIPKYRRKILQKGIAEYCEEVIKTEMIDRYPDVRIEEINIEIDHVHVIAIIPPKYAISRIIGEMKSRSSKKMREKYEYIKRNETMWSIGYFVSSVGLDEKKIRRYVKYQEKQDKGQAKLV